MSAHTPGPWKVVMELNGKPSVWTDEPEDERIRLARINCDVKKVDEQAFAEAMADARLIAAAPDLLAACVEMLAELRANELNHDTNEQYVIDARWRMELRAEAAIAKARGGK